MEMHVKYGKHSKEDKESSNRRNGSYEKTIIDEEGRRNITVDGECSLNCVNLK